MDRINALKALILDNRANIILGVIVACVTIVLMSL